MVTGTRKNTLAAEIQARSHKIISGISENFGGQDEGPTPHEIVEAALAACTIMTVQMYANRKGIKLESADVNVKIASEGPETKIEREVSFRGELDSEQRAALARIAEKCPVHKLLESHIKIESKFK